MDAASNAFGVFLLAAVILYYAVPRHARWMVLLAASLIYYILSGGWAVVFLLFSAAATFLAARRISGINERFPDRSEAKKRSKGTLIAGLAADLAALLFLKYSNFFLLNAASLFRFRATPLRLLLPLGISYYTFQTIAYLADVYWNRISAERNFLRYLLFVSFFPQMAQGPINRFSALSRQLFDGNAYDARNVQEGILRITWGLFKKMVLADWASVYVAAIFGNPDKYAGIAIFGVLLYTAELYGNFSGGIDIMLGVARLFGVELAENFRQPFFAVTVSDFWQRWHITLGSFMKDYVFYPLTRSRGMSRLGKASRKVFGKRTGRLIPVAITNIIVFLLVGLWHGPTWGNIGWGLYNGVIIAAATLMESSFEGWKKSLGIREEAAWWKVFRILRTFALMNLSWYFDCADSFGTARKMIGYSLSRFEPGLFLRISAGNLGRAYTPYALLTIVCASAVVFFISLRKEKGGDPMKAVMARSAAVRFACAFLLLVSVPLFGPTASAGGFIYAQF